jgi:hypothetical protein
MHCENIVLLVILRCGPFGKFWPMAAFKRESSFFARYPHSQPVIYSQHERARTHSIGPNYTFQMAISFGAKYF